MVQYTSEELSSIRAAISGEKNIREDANFAALEDKLRNDEIFQNYGAFSFFPESYDLLRGKEGNITAEPCGETRGRGIIIHSSKKDIVIKPIQIALTSTDAASADEIEIAKFAGKIEFGPVQYNTLKGFLSEEYLKGEFILSSKVSSSAEDFYNYGLQFGKGLSKMHQNEYFYNDTTIADDMGKSHVIITDKGVRLIDFGVAINLKNHPHYSYEQAANFGRTLPGASMFTAMNPSPEAVMDFVSHYQNIMKQISKDEILKRDLQFLAQGLDFYEMRKNVSVSNSFKEGFWKEYKR
jgi:tRNA A-37 threonylcarbamoyl transferase component Bud32